MANFGWSFAPGTQETMGGPSRTNGTPNDPVQEAIQILTLRLPKHYGAGAIAPAPIMQAMGGMGQPGARGDVTAHALAMLAGVPMRSSPAPTMPMPALPSSSPVIAPPSPAREEQQNRERPYSSGEYATPEQARRLGIQWQPREAVERANRARGGLVHIGAGNQG